MQVKRILNRVQKHQGFVYTEMELVEENSQLVLNVTLEPRRNSRAVCSGCGHKRAGYDRLGSRRFEFIPFWGILVYFVYPPQDRRGRSRPLRPFPTVGRDPVGPWPDGVCEAKTMPSCSCPNPGHAAIPTRWLRSSGKSPTTSPETTRSAAGAYPERSSRPLRRSCRHTPHIGTAPLRWAMLSDAHSAGTENRRAISTGTGSPGTMPRP